MTGQQGVFIALFSWSLPPQKKNGWAWEHKRTSEHRHGQELGKHLLSAAAQPVVSLIKVMQQIAIQ